MKYLSIITAFLFFISCGEQASTEEVTTDEAEVVKNVEVASDLFFGEEIDDAGAIDVSELYAQLESFDSVKVKFATTIIETCTRKGCWMTVELEEGKDMMVRFKDYGFFVPLEGMGGKATIFEGYAYTETVSVEDLQHYADDAGKDSTEIAEITEPEVALTFLASGVIIKN